MKRILLIALTLIIGLWLVAGPLAVGTYLRTWGPAWIETWGPTTSHQFDSGWFESRMAAEWPDGSRMVLTGRHLPPTRPAWLALIGEFQSVRTPDPIRIKGRFGVFGNLELTMTSPRLKLNEAIELDAGRPAVRILQQASGAFELEANFAYLEMTDARANRLQLEASKLRVDWKPRSQNKADLELALDTGRDGQDPSHARLEFLHVDRRALAEFVTGFEQFRVARPDSFEARMAALTMAGAWQQLAEAGLEVELKRLDLDGQARFSGRWEPATGHPQISGDGITQSLLDWLQPIIGLVGDVDTEDAEREARAWLEALANRRWLHTQDDTFHFRFDGAKAGENRANTVPVPEHIGTESPPG